MLQVCLHNHQTPISGGSREGWLKKFPLAAGAEIIRARFSQGFGIHNSSQVLVFTSSPARQRLYVSRSTDQVTYFDFFFSVILAHFNQIELFIIAHGLRCLE